MGSGCLEGGNNVGPVMQAELLPRLPGNCRHDQDTAIDRHPIGGAGRQMADHPPIELIPRAGGGQDEASASTL